MSGGMERKLTSVDFTERRGGCDVSLGIRNLTPAERQEMDRQVRVLMHVLDRKHRIFDMDEVRYWYPILFPPLPIGRDSAMEMGLEI